VREGAGEKTPETIEVARWFIVESNPSVASIAWSRCPSNRR